MAPKRTSRFLENPSSVSPSPSQDQESEEEAFESGEEEQQVQTPQKFHMKSTGPQKPNQSSSSEEEDGEEKEEEDGADNIISSPISSDFTIKPSKNQPQTKPTATRVLEVQKDDAKKESRKKKPKVVKENGGETKRVAGNTGGGTSFGRVWSEEDELALLKGMIDYQDRVSADPHADMGAFHEFVKGRFGFDVTRSQVYEKVRRLKGKYRKQIEKGEPFVFSNPHQENCFELSKKIWCFSKGDGGGVSNGIPENVEGGESKVKRSSKLKSTGDKSKEEGKKKRVIPQEVDDGEKRIVENSVVKDNGGGTVSENGAVKDELVNDEVDFSVKYPYLTESLNLENFPPAYESQRKLIKRNVGLLGSEKARELDMKWKKLQMEQIECFHKQMGLMAEQLSLVMEARKEM